MPVISNTLAAIDRHSRVGGDRAATEEELLAGKEPQTQFGRAMEELSVRLILARSPQAKGRVERMNGTLQDRLVKALRRRKISDLASANRFLEEEFLARFNAQFGVPPAAAADLHRAVPAEVDVLRVLSVQEERLVQNDWTVRWKNAYLQLPRASRVQPGATVQVCEQLGGRVRVFVGDCELLWSATRSEPSRPRRAVPQRSGPPKSNQGLKPSARHPWRKLSVSAAASPPPPAAASSS